MLSNEARFQPYQSARLRRMILPMSEGLTCVGGNFSECSKRGSSVAACGRGATIGQDTTNWRVDGGSRERSASTVPPCRLPGGTAKARLDGHHHGDALFRILRR